MPNLFIISGCNGAGKTTASYTILPEMLKCNEFVNADEIAKGLSPFQPEKAMIDAGRIMLHRIKELTRLGNCFAVETILASKTYLRFIEHAKSQGYYVTLVYFWLNCPELAVERVKKRVKQGGHNIPEEVIYRRYKAGLKNLNNLYLDVADFWMILDNSNFPTKFIAEGHRNISKKIYFEEIYSKIIKQ